MNLPKIKTVSRRQSQKYQTPFAFPFSRNAPFVFLKGNASEQERYSYLAYNPFLMMTRKNFAGDVFSHLQTVLDFYHGHEISLFGAFAYHAHTPDCFFIMCKDVVRFDEFHKIMEHVHVELDTTCRHSSLELESSFLIHERRLDSRFRGNDNISSNFTQKTFCAAVAKVIEHIAAGDIYQANIAQRFETPYAADLFSLFQAAYKINPAPMMAFMQAEDFSLVSTSPERFLRRRGERLDTMPIKGTRPRGKTEQEDQRLREELFTSEKDAAELAMIVDLMRNDLGKVATPGTVRVDTARRIEAYTNVFHAIADVSAEVSKTISSLEIIRACFPAGSVTGCPKLRAMEIIDEIEPVPRDYYCGSIGRLDANGDFDFNVAIRTFVATQGKLFFHLGSGIVFDSDPETEYQETLAKGESMFALLREQT